MEEDYWILLWQKHDVYRSKFDHMLYKKDRWTGDIPAFIYPFLFTLYNVWHYNESLNHKAN